LSFHHESSHHPFDGTPGGSFPRHFLVFWPSLGSPWTEIRPSESSHNPKNGHRQNLPIPVRMGKFLIKPPLCFYEKRTYCSSTFTDVSFSARSTKGTTPKNVFQNKHGPSHGRVGSHYDNCWAFGWHRKGHSIHTRESVLLTSKVRFAYAIDRLPFKSLYPKSSRSKGFCRRTWSLI